MVVALAGATGNVVFAVGLAWVVYLVGKPVMPGDGAAVVGFVETNTAAYAQGLRAGDEVLTVNGEKVRSWQDFIQLAALADKVDLQVQAAGLEPRTVKVPTTKSALGFQTVDGVMEGFPCRVRAVEQGWSAAQAGVQSGDVIRRFDGESIGGIEQLVDLVSARQDREVPMVVERKGELVELAVTPRLDPDHGRARIGIQFDTLVVETPSQQMKRDASGIVRMLRALVTPKEASMAAQNLGGPVSIVVTLWAYVQMGLIRTLAFTRFLNVNLAIINLLPIPILDGGHIVFGLCEWATRRRPSVRVMNVLVNVFLALLLTAFLYLTYRDFIRIRVLRNMLRQTPQEAVTNVPPVEAPAK